MAYTISRTECWQRYYVVDFGLSRLYDNPPPEYKQAWCHPFRADICFVGNLLRIQFTLSESSQILWFPKTTTTHTILKIMAGATTNLPLFQASQAGRRHYIGKSRHSTGFVDA
jgi:hypothetical protein